MKFVCLCYYEHARFAAMTPGDHAAIERDCRPHDQALKATGRVLISTSLSLPDEARVIRPGDGGPTVTKGPYTDTPEPVGALFIVDAANMERAVEIASKHPGAHFATYFGGGIEVRAFDFFEQYPLADA